jgi:uroporphyrinogen-III decarboxylase
MAYTLMQQIDSQEHNEEVRRVWDAYSKRQPYRVPVSVSGSIRNLFGNPAINDTAYTFEDFFNSPEAQIACQLAYQRWQRYNLLCDREMGPPTRGWQIAIDFQNSYEAAWMGCPFVFHGNDVPDTREILKEDKRRLYHLKPPDPPWSGTLLARALEFFEYMQAHCPQREFEGCPVLPPTALPGEGTDGPFDLAYKLRGATEVCIDMLEDPGYFHDLMTFLTDHIIERIKALRQWRWKRFPGCPDEGQFRRPYGFADDAIALISAEQYERFVFPYHCRLVEAFSDGGPTSVHLCGDATRHFRFLRDRLRVRSFDTGFPVDFGALRRDLGPDIEIYGGPTVMLLKNGSPAAIREEVRRVCSSGIMEGGRFVLREANNLAPCTPVANVVAFYEAGKEFGRYPEAAAG